MPRSGISFGSNPVKCNPRNQWDNRMHAHRGRVRTSPARSSCSCKSVSATILVQMMHTNIAVVVSDAVSALA